MVSVEVGQIYEIASNGMRFKVLCIDDGECFVKWADGGYHGILDINRVLTSCTLVNQIEQTDCPWQ